MESFNGLNLADMSELIELAGQTRVEEPENPVVTEPIVENTEQDKDTLPDPEVPSNLEDNNDKNDNESPLLPYAKLLVAEGVLRESDIEGFDGSADGLIDAEKKKFLSWQEEYKAGFDPRVKWLQDNIEAGIPLEELLAIDKANVTYSNISNEAIEADVELSKNLVRNYYKATTKFTDARIEKEINRLDDLSELVPEAKAALEELKALTAEQEQSSRQQAEQAKIQAVEQRKQTLETFKKNLEDKKEIITGLEFNRVMKDKVYNTLTSVVGYDQNGQPLNKIAQARAANPLEFETTLAYIYELTNGFKDFSPIASRGKKQAIAEFEQAAGRIDTKKFSGEFSSDPRGTKNTAMSHIDAFLKATNK